ALGVPQRRVARLDHARPRDERQRRAVADGDRPDARPAARHYRFTTLRPPRSGASRLAARCCTAPRMKPLKSGWQSVGRDLNSGWNWVARNQGWSRASIISTTPPAGDTPDPTSP